MTAERHFHQCGLTAVGRIPFGCGKIWSHEEPKAKAYTKDFCQAHRCPECGRGPWYERLEEGNQEVDRNFVTGLLAASAVLDHLEHSLWGERHKRALEELTHLKSDLALTIEKVLDQRSTQK